MLKLVDISKIYKTGELTQQALDGVSLEFRQSEFVAILESLYENGYSLIDINDMYENYTDTDGTVAILTDGDKIAVQPLGK